MTISNFPFGTTFNGFGFNSVPFGGSWSPWGGSVPFGYTGSTYGNHIGTGFQNWNTPFTNWSNYSPINTFNGTPFTPPFNWFSNFNTWNTTPCTGVNGSSPWTWYSSTPWNWNYGHTFGGFPSASSTIPFYTPFNSSVPFNYYGYPTPFTVPFGYTIPNFWNGTVPFVSTPANTTSVPNVTPTTVSEQTTTGNRVVYPFPFGGFNPFVYVGPQGIVNGTPATQAA